MEVDPALIIVVIGSVGGLLIERFFYYRSKYKEKKACKPVDLGNPGNYGERIATLEEAVQNIKDDVEKIQEKLNKK